MSNRSSLKDFNWIKKVSWIWMILCLVAASVFTTVLVQYVLLDETLFGKLSDTKWLWNISCVLALYTFVLFITGRLKMSLIISHVFFMVLTYINYFVYLFRENEFIFSDLRAIATGLSVAGNYDLVLHDRGWHGLIASVLFIVLVNFLPISLKKEVYVRLLSGLSTVGIAIFVMFQVQDVNTETWEQKGSYLNGYVLNFVLSARDSFVAAPEEYSLDTIEALETEYEDVESNVIGESLDKEPTIIVVMNESFADLSVIGPMQTNEPLTPFMDSLTENTIKGYALASVFGAKTPNSEWEFMTGSTMAFLPAGSVVYQQYISDTPTSVVSTLKNEGYTCVSMHPYYETGWSRNLIYPTLGFDESYFLESFDQTQLVRKYVSDRELYRKIIERYENRGVNENLFIMSISMQNHGGYTTDYENFQENYYKVGRSYTDANQYFSLIRESDDALQELITYFSQEEEPVEIIFFGDHQPSLTNNFYKILNAKGLSGLTLEELQNLYTVPFFIWTNYDTPEDQVEMTSLNYLSTMMLERAGIDLPAYHQFMKDLMEVVPAINARGYYSKEAERYLHVDEAIGVEAEWILKYQGLQYNGLFDTKNTSEVFFPYLKE